MSNPREKFNELMIERLMNNLKKRGLNGHYCKSTDELVETAMQLVKDCKTVTSGGSMTLKESGILDMLSSMPDIEFVNRENYSDPKEVEEVYRKAFSSDCYFMSTNAITEDGILVNIDGRGNRVAALIYGPKRVVIIAGVNKITSTFDEAILRARTIAAPINSMRLNKNTPCVQTGVCANCLSPDCICDQFVITRKSMDPDRIHVILVDEEYGY